MGSWDREDLVAGVLWSVGPSFAYGDREYNVWLGGATGWETRASGLLTRRSFHVGFPIKASPILLFYSHCHKAVDFCSRTAHKISHYLLPSPSFCFTS